VLSPAQGEPMDNSGSRNGWNKYDRSTLRGTQGTSLVGIDLGTVCSCVAAFNQASGQVEVCTSDTGNRTIPSCVAFTDAERLIGDSAFNQAATNPRNTIFDAMRFVGRRFSDATVQADMKLFPVTAVPDEEDKLRFTVNYQGVQKKYYPEEILSMLLSKIKFFTESYLGKPLTGAVITVPADFGDSQRQAIRDAAHIVGLDCHRILSAPVAAALSCMYDRRAEKRIARQTVLVCDVGGGSVCAALVMLDGHVCEVKGMAGQLHPAGNDLDTRLVEHCIRSFRELHGKDLSGSQRALRRLRTHCERAKCSLSSANEATVDIDSLFDGADFSCKITRQLLQELTTDLCHGTLRPVQEVLARTSIRKEDVDEVVLVGGSSRVPLIQSVVQDFFGSKPLCKSLDPSEANARGAAVFAASIGRLCNDPGCQGFDALYQLRDIAVAPLGLEDSDGKMVVFVPRGSRLPVRSERTIRMTFSSQVHVVARAYEGDAKYVSECLYLGCVKLPVQAHEGAEIHVVFVVDIDGVLTVRLRNAEGNQEATATMQHGALSTEELKRRVLEAQVFAGEDKQNRLRIRAKDRLESICYQVRNAVQASPSHGMSDEQRGKVERVVQDILDWLDFGDPLPAVAAKLKEHFPLYNFGYDEARSMLPADAPLRRLEEPLRESNRGYRDALDKVTERDTLQVIIEMDGERSVKGLLIKDSLIARFNEQAPFIAAGKLRSNSVAMDDLEQHFAEFLTTAHVDPDPLLQRQHIVADIMRVAAAAQEELRRKLCSEASAWQPLDDAPGHFCCEASLFADYIRDPGTKSEERVRQKANAKYWQLLDRRFARVRDIARVCLSYNSLEGMLRGLQRVRDEFKVVEIENRFAKPTALGWRDITALVELPLPDLDTVHIAEIQMSHRELVEARRRLHKYWKVVRELLPGTCRVAVDDMDVVQDAILTALEERSHGTVSCTVGDFEAKLLLLQQSVAEHGTRELKFIATG